MLNKTNTTQQHLLRILLAAVCIVGTILAISTGAAQAKLIHPYTGQSFGPQGIGGSDFNELDAVTIDPSTGDLYVFSEEAAEKGLLYKFTATGEPANFSSTGTNKIEISLKHIESGSPELAVDGSSGPAKGDIYLETNEVVEIFSAAGVKLGEFKGEVRNSYNGVAVDSTGAVYIAEEGKDAIKKYVPTANPVTNADYTSSLSLSGVRFNAIAADSEGDIYGLTGEQLLRYSSMQFVGLGAVGTPIAHPGGRYLAFDPADNHIFVSQDEYIDEFNEMGELESVTGEEELRGEESPTRVAVNPLNGDVYASQFKFIEGQYHFRLLIFAGSTVVVPEAITEAPTGVADTTATLDGSVNPGGLPATYQFQYGPSTEYGSVTPASPQIVGSDSTAHHLSAELTNLVPGSTIHYRIIATNANGTTHGADQVLYVHGPPTVASMTARFITQDSVELVGGVDPHGLETQAHLEYGTTTAYGNTSASEDVGSGGEVRNIYDEIEEGLMLGTTYHFRVVATNADGTVYGPDETFSTAPVASIMGEAALDVTSSSASLTAKVNDYGHAATVRFEYGATAEYGASTVPAKLFPAESSRSTTAVLNELSAGTSYHYRLVVESEAGTEHGADATFKTPSITAPPMVLPDGRGYEKVSPTANADGDVYQDVPVKLALAGGWTEQPFLVSPDGSAVAYMGDPSERGGTGSEGPDNGNQYVARRGVDGRWVAENVEPPSSGFSDQPAFKGFSSDLTVGFVNSRYTPALAPGAPSDGYSELYAKNFSTGTYTPLITATPANRTQQNFGAAESPTFNVNGAEIAYGGSSADRNHELFMANDALTSGALDGGVAENDLYDTSGGTTTLVNVLPDGTTEPNATFGGPALAIDKGDKKNYPIFAHDISEDGSRIFWTDLNTGGLYVRENDTAPQSPLIGGKCTVADDACTVLIAEGAQYWNATPDGSEVLYTKAGDLYEYDLETGQTVDLAPGGKVHGVVAASSDLSFVYFVTEPEEAVPGAQRQHCEEAKGGGICNLDVVHVGGPTRFVGTLSGSDNSAGVESFNRFTGDWQGSLGDTEAEATPDGTHLLFTSSARPTGYASGSSEQVFMYDYDSERLNCLSCKPNGEPITKEFSAFLPVSSVGTAAPHWMSDDGNRVFFDTLEALVPQDINEATDVYEWERDGSGECTEPQGCIYLLSDGTSPEGAFLIGAGTSGDDVFMTTRGRLVPEDENENIDVYDVRVGAKPPVTPPQCTGSGCQGVPSPPPIFSTPPSVTYNGVGNFEAPTKPVVKAAVKAKGLTRAQKLARALKACEKKQKRQRASCVVKARKRYGAGKKAKGSSLKHGNVSRSSGRGK